MRDNHFSQRKPVPTDLYWVPAAAALLVLVLRFLPVGFHTGAAQADEARVTY